MTAKARLGSRDVQLSRAPTSSRHGEDMAGSVLNTALWSDAIGAYRAIRPLAAEELALIDLLHLAGVVGGLHHWFTWVLDEARSFPDPAAVLARVDFLLKNLDSVLDQTDAGSGGVH